jgi:hypothetical protein
MTYLIELFIATGKLRKFFLQLEIFDVCTTGDTAHNLNIVSMYAVSPLVHTSNFSSCQKNLSVFLWL